VTGESLQAGVNNLYEKLQKAADQVTALTSDAIQKNKNMKALESIIEDQNAKYLNLMKDAKRMSQEFAEKQAETSAIIEEQAEQLARYKKMTPESNNKLQGHRKIKIGKLEKFDGDRKRIRAFLTGARRQMQVEGLHVVKESDKVLYISSFLEKDPETWFEPFLREY
jgi:predicted RNase H-like nuclease (RuvC/YqgF family)